MNSKLEIIETKKGLKKLSFILQDSRDEQIVIPQGVEIVPADCFSYLGNLTHIDIPEGVVMICIDAFRECSALKSITLPSTLVYLGASVFDGCTALDEVTLPDSLATHFGKELEGLDAVGGCMGSFRGSSIKRVTLSAAFEPYIKLLQLPATAEINYI